MLIYSELFQFCMVVIGIVGLFIQVHKKKQPPSAPQLGGYFL